jgi:hypothetical protein
MVDSFHCWGSSFLIQKEIISLWILERIFLPPAVISSAGILSVLGHLCLFLFSKLTHKIMKSVLLNTVQLWSLYCGKGKGLPQQAAVAQGVPDRLRPLIFLTFRHYKGGRSSAKRTGHLYPRRNTLYSFSEAESTSGRIVLSGVARKKSPVTPPGIDSGISRLVAQCLNHYATPGLLSAHLSFLYTQIKYQDS